MAILLMLALVLAGVAIGAAGMRRAGQWARRLTGPWRPGVGVGALICFLGAGALVVRGAEMEAVGLGAVGLVLAIVARRRSPKPTQNERKPAATSMTQSEARRILGVDAEADQIAIEAAYRRLMQRAHPDLGGTSGLAAQLNAAREALIRRA